MAFEKGNRLATGRPKGSPNKISKPIREALREIVQGELPRVQKNLRAIELKSKVHHAELVLKITEYVLPRLSRIEMHDVSSFDELASLSDEARRYRLRELANQILNNNNNNSNEEITD